MYNRYLDQPTGPVVPEHRDGEARREPPRQTPPPPPPHRTGDLLKDVTGGVGEVLSGLLKHFSLEKLDNGDILLVLIMLFLFLEGDNLELVITLGLMLLLGLGEDTPAS